MCNVTTCIVVGSVSPRMTHPEFGQHIFMNPSPNRLRSLLCLVDALPILIFTCCRRAKGKVTESLAPRLGGMCLFWRFYVAFGCLSRALEHSVALCEDRIRGLLPFFWRLGGGFVGASNLAFTASWLHVCCWSLCLLAWLSSMGLPL